MTDVSEKAAENFNKGTESKKPAEQLVNVIKIAKARFLVSTLSVTATLEIYTNPDGEVIFKNIPQ